MTRAPVIAVALVATALAARPWGWIAADEAAAARLIEVGSRAAGPSFEVPIDASAPAAYTTHQPDERTVVVEHRNVSARMLVDRGGPIADFLIEGSGDNGTTRTRLHLGRSIPYTVSSARSTISVGFDAGAVDPIAGVAVPATNPAATAPVQETRRTATVLAAETRPAGAAPATRLRTIDTLLETSALVVRLRANGILTPSSIHEAEDAPPRIVIDLPKVESAVPPVTRVDAGPVRQIRVAPHSHVPLVTRVVFDLATTAPYRVEGIDAPSAELRVIFPLDDETAATASPVVEARPAPDLLSLAALAPSQASAPSTDTVPLGETKPAPRMSANTIVLDPLAALRAPGPVSPAQPVGDVLADAVVDAVRWVESAAIAHATKAYATPGTEPVATIVEEAPPADEVARTPPSDPLGGLRRTETVVTELLSETPSIQSPEATALPVPDAGRLAATAPTRPIARRTKLAIPATAPAASVAGVQTAATSPGGIPRPGLTAPRRFAAEVTTTRFIHRGTVTSPPRAQVTQQTLGGARQYTGSLVSMDFQNADLRSVLRTFAEISDLNIVIDPQVQGSVDVALVDVPWDQALDIILRSNQLGYDVDATVVRIAPLSTLTSEEQQRRELAEQQALAGELVVLTRTLSYARASDLANLVTQAVLSERGQVQIDARTNTLILTDLQANLLAAQELLGTLDRPEPQVEIEARIVALRCTSQALQLCVTEILGTTVDLGAPSRTSDLGVTLGSVDDSSNLSRILSAAEGEGQVEIVFNPRITTQNNVQATLIQGDQIPIQTVVNNTVTVQFKDAALRLAVTPQITAADTVIMEIEIDNDFADFGKAVNGIPPIVTQRAITTVQVADGDTTVIGGIYESDRQRRNDRVSGFSKIPLLGWFFKRETDVEDTDQLLIFLTPYIVR